MSADSENKTGIGEGVAAQSNPVKVFLVDYLGSHCGMHYYDDAFLKVLDSVPGISVEVLSNYSSVGQKPFFRNFYNVPKAAGVLYLLAGCMKLLRLVLRNRKAVFVVLSFGNQIDMGMMWLVSLARRAVVDVHEVIAQKDEDRGWFRRVFRFIYRRRIKNVIIHSERSAHMLDELGYGGRRFFVPHFRYGISHEYDTRKIGNDVADAFDSDKINILFFGNIMYNKGIDLLVDAVNMMPDEQVDRIRVVVAGKETDDTLSGCVIRRQDTFRIIARHINDDELAFLYSGTDYVVLPYRKTSQSGILEMAFHFRKPVIAAGLPYFESVLAGYPSFGMITGTDAESLSETLSALTGHGKPLAEQFFQPDDIYSYEHRAETDEFAARFGEYILNGNK